MYTWAHPAGAGEGGSQGTLEDTRHKSQHTGIGTWWKESCGQPKQNLEQAVTWLGMPSTALQAEENTAPVLGAGARTVFENPPWALL